MGDNRSDTATVSDVIDLNIGSSTMPLSTPAATEATSFISEIPEEYRDKGWAQLLAKSANPKLEQWRMMDSAQSLVGRREQFKPPAPDADPETLAAWRRQIGVPDSPDAYKIAKPDWGENKEIGAWIESTISDEHIKTMWAAAHKAGVTPQQLQIMSDAWNASAVNEYRRVAQLDAASDAQIEAELNKALDIEFHDTLVAKYGNRVNDVIDHGNAVLHAIYTPQEFAQLDSLGSAELARLADAAWRMAQKFGREDGFSRDGMIQTSGFTAETARQEAMKLMMEQQGLDKMDPRRDSLQKRIRELHVLSNDLTKQAGQNAQKR